MRYLIIAAHPDDEVLGAGASIAKWVREGHQVAVAFMADHAAARRNLSDSLQEERDRALQMLGVCKTYSADFPNIRMNTVAHLELVQFVEGCIRDFRADVLVTHHPSDVNIDHAMTSGAVQAACRLFQRQEDIPALRELLYMEVPSSTDWILGNEKGCFVPNYFVEIGPDGVEEKLAVLAQYRGVMRDYPHPRSREALTGLAAYRGGQAGVCYAEAFACVFRRG